MAPDTYISLFAGGGALDLAVRIARPKARCIGYVEVGIEAAELLASRIEERSLDEAPIWSDLRTFPGRLYRGRVAGIVAGFPCPDYSVAGKRAGIRGKHGQLWDYLADTIRDLGPDWILLENVPGILIPHGSGDGDGDAVLPAGLWFVLGDLADLGLDAQWIRIRASDVGASHGRARWFCLAYRQSRGRRISRQSSGSSGLAHGRNAPVDNSARHGEQGCNGEAGRRERRRVREAGDGMANAVDGQLSERGRRAQRRDGPRPASEILLADPAGDNGRSGERRSEAGTRPHGIGRRRSASGDDVVGHSDCEGSQGWRERGHCADERASRAAGDSELADAERESYGPEQFPGAGKREDCGAADGSMSGNAGDLPLFAPGPGATELWQELLVRYPWLRPAISSAEAESALRGMADGMASLVGSGRTDALRAIGNGVVPLQAALAFIVLAARAGLEGMALKV